MALEDSVMDNSPPNRKVSKNLLRLGHFLIVLAAAFPGNLWAASLEKVWEVDLKEALHGERRAADQSFKVMKLLFSPDAEQIAVLLMGDNNIELVRAQDPNTSLGEFKNDGYDFFGWSPDSQIFYSGKHIVHLADRKACDLPSNAIAPHFIGKGSLVALFAGVAPLTPNGRTDFRQRGPAHLRIYDADCQEQDSWEVPASWFIGNASPERGLLLISQIVAGSPWTAQMIVDPFKKKILHSWSGPDAPRGRFADQGKSICGRVCWDVDSGKKVVPDQSIRVVVDDYKQPSLFSPFSEMAARRRVWDYRTGKEVVSWKLNFLTYSTRFDLDGFYRDRRPIPCAISPTGDYIVEGGDGKIWLYKIKR
jgi:hypothetical protein